MTMPTPELRKDMACQSPCRKNSWGLHRALTSLSILYIACSLSYIYRSRKVMANIRFLQDTWTTAFLPSSGCFSHRAAEGWENNWILQRFVIGYRVIMIDRGKEKYCPSHAVSITLSSRVQIMISKTHHLPSGSIPVERNQAYKDTCTEELSHTSVYNTVYQRIMPMIHSWKLGFVYSCCEVYGFTNRDFILFATVSLSAEK